MHVRVYGVQPDELEVYREAEEKYGFTFEFAKELLCEENVGDISGCEAVILVTACHVTEQTAKKMAEQGVRYLATRSAGSDHIDYEAVRKYGMCCANVPFYAPEAIAEYTIFMALSVLRHSKRSRDMAEQGDFTLKGLKGRQLGKMTAGVMGTGRIGCATMTLLKGFGANILGWDPYPNERAGELCRYVTKEQLMEESDILFLHCPLTEDNYHIIGADALERQMKPGAILINSARGGLVDHEAVLKALKRGRLGGFAFDVYERENLFLRKKVSWDQIDDPVFRELVSREDTVYSAHMAFCTDNAIRNMIEVTLDNLKEYEMTGKCRNEIVRQ